MKVAKSKVLRLAPVRNGKQVASTWRIWTQGDECYLAMRHAVQSAKISLHRNHNWQLRIGHAVYRLVPSSGLPDNWVLPIQLAFFVDSDAFHPLQGKCGQSTAIDIPDGDKLIVNVLFAPASGSDDLDLPPQFWRNKVLGQLPLTSGRRVVVTAALFERTMQDDMDVKRIRANLKIKASKPRHSPRGAIYAEAMELSRNVTTRGGASGLIANVAYIVPVGEDSLVVTEAD